MANPSYTLITATGNTTYYPDIFQSPFNLSYAVEFASGATGTYTITYSLDDPNPAPATSPEFGWTSIFIADPQNGGSLTGTVAGSYGFPIRMLRVHFSAISGKVMFVVLQGMSSR